MVKSPFGLDPPYRPPAITSNELRANLSEVINFAAFGSDPVVIMRRGKNVAAIISMHDLAFLQMMQEHREEDRRRRRPPGT